MFLTQRFRGLFELAFTVVIAVGLAFAVQAWAVKPYKIPTASMEPTLVEGQRVLVDRLFDSPHVGQVVVFHPPAGADSEECGRSHPASAACEWPEPTESSQTFIKRIVAGPGDVITIENGQSSEMAGYRSGCRRSRLVVSRGPVPAKWIIGDAFFNYWPPNRIGFF